MTEGKFSLSSLQSMQVRLGNTGIRVSPLGIGVAILLVFSLGAYTTRNPAMVSTDDMVSMKELLKASIDFAERGGKVLVDIRNSPDIGQGSKGSHDDVAEGDIGKDDPVTNGDKESHKAMFYGFKYFFPNTHVMSEERTETVDKDDVPAPNMRNREVDRLVTDDMMIPADELTIWIDPLDATQEYTEDLRQYVTTMVCIVRGDTPIAAVIHKPFEKTNAWAWVGHGTNLVDDSSGASPLSIIVSRSHAGDVKEVATKGLGDKVEVIPAGGAGYKAWALFDGTAKAYLHTTLIKKWDICPGDAILRHFPDGKMTQISGAEIKYGHDTGEKSEGGLLATLHDHQKFLDGLKDAYNV